MSQQYLVFDAENGLLLATHWPYSTDLAPSNVFLFGYVRHCLAKMAFPSHTK
jgi:hypothetical protein